MKNWLEVAKERLKPVHDQKEERRGQGGAGKYRTPKKGATDRPTRPVVSPKHKRGRFQTGENRCGAREVTRPPDNVTPDEVTREGLGTQDKPLAKGVGRLVEEFEGEQDSGGRGRTKQWKSVWSAGIPGKTMDCQQHER